jgi:hypothetical protein
MSDRGPTGRERRVVEAEAGCGQVGGEDLPPDPRRLVYALRQIGYSLEQALSDLVDNSINASADTVLIRFICSGEKIVRIVVADNGQGMSAAELRNAMRFGSSVDRRVGSLGKFGMGLKLATFSHAQTLTVGSVRKGRASARRWSLEGIGNNWRSDILDRKATQLLVAASYHPLDLSRSGTVVIWDDIDKLPISRRGLRFTVTTIHRRLQLHLGMCFHRFIEKKKLRILVDQQEAGRAEHHIQVPITALDPFAYSCSGHPQYPRTYSAVIGPALKLRLRGHIWPPNSSSEEYRLGNRAAARQGFYFYRNDRLIQAGGWNGLVQSESEPHGSLARVAIDLPGELDDVFGLNVQKSSVVAPPGFVEAVLSSKSRAGGTFEEFRHHAHEVYRRHDRRAVGPVTLVPARGFPAAVRKSFLSLLGNEESHSSQKAVNIIWSQLPEDEFFQVDQESSEIRLNSLYREDLLLGLSPSGTDVPLLKFMIFFLAEQDLLRSSTSRDRRTRLKAINRMLIDAVKLRRG